MSVTAAKGFVASGIHCGVKPSGEPDLSLVAGCREAMRFRGKLRLLQPRVGGHPLRLVGPGQLEGGEAEVVEAREGDELVLVAQGGDLALEAGHGRLVHVASPVEARRAVVGKHLVGMVPADALGETLRLLEVGL